MRTFAIGTLMIIAGTIAFTGNMIISALDAIAMPALIIVGFLLQLLALLRLKRKIDVLEFKIEEPIRKRG